MNIGQQLTQRYEVKKVLGHGGFAETYLATDIRSGQLCVIKHLSLRHIEEWKTLELFEREARALKNLQHPQIPRYIDFFSHETEQNLDVYLVQEYVEGQNLADLLREGKHFSQQEALELALGITRILEYLHHFSPPLIHRDIKPSNILIPAGKPPYLVDFGAVRDTLCHDAPGAPTVVGTYGYMPLEQLEGRAVPASDIYSLGMALIAVLSRKDPAQIEKRGLQLDFRPYVNISRQFAGILERMIHPDWQARYHNASELRRALEHLSTADTPQTQFSRFSPRPVLLVLVAFLIMLMGMSGYLFMRFQSSPSPESTPTPVSEPAPNAPAVNAPPQTAISEEMPLIMPVDGELNLNIYRDFEFVAEGNPLGLSVGQSQAGGLDTLPYEHLAREPTYHADQVRYGYFSLGNAEDRQISFALDEVERSQWVVYLDANNNEDLSDDGPPHQNQGSGVLAVEATLEFDLVLPDGASVRQPYTLWMWLNKAQTGVNFYARCHYRAHMSLAGQTYTAIAFEQFQHDGLYRESGIWIDLNQDGQLDEATEHFQDSASLVVDQASYQINLLYP